MADDGLAEVYKQPDEAAEEKAKQAAADFPVVNSFRDIFHIPGEK